MKHLITLLLLLCTLLSGPVSAQPRRALKICVAADAPAEVRRAARSVLDAIASHSLLQVMSEGGTPTELTDSQKLAAAKPEERAYSHLILIGLPNDPLVHATWQREARVEEGGFYVFGWGHLHGDIGYIESDRNPFLHGAAIASAPLETEVVTLTGSTPAGVAKAVEAFLQHGVINGVVTPPGWTRPRTTSLDRDPLQTMALPAWLPSQAGAAQRIGLSAANEDEYRGVLDDTGIQPLEIWRAKFYRPGAWDGAGEAKAFETYVAGLHRRAYGNTLWLARFESSEQATQAAPRIASAAKLQKQGGQWTGAQPIYATAAYPGGNESSGLLTLWQRGEWLLMSTLPREDTTALQAAITD